MCVCKSTNTDVKNNIVQATWCYLITLFLKSAFTIVKIIK